MSHSPVYIGTNEWTRPVVSSSSSSSFIPHRCSIACLPLFFLLPPSFIVDDWSLFNRKLIIDRRVDFKLDRRRWKDRAIISVITRDGRSGKFWEREGWVDIGLIRAPGTGWKIEDLVDVGTMGHVAARSKRVARRRESSGKRWKRPGILDGQVCQGDQFCALRVEMCPMAFLPAPFVPRDRHSPRADNKATWLIIRHRELELKIIRIAIIFFWNFLFSFFLPSAAVTRFFLRFLVYIYTFHNVASLNLRLDRNRAIRTRLRVANGNRYRSESRERPKIKGEEVTNTFTSSKIVPKRERERLFLLKGATPFPFRDEKLCFAFPSRR